MSGRACAQSRHAALTPAGLPCARASRAPRTASGLLIPPPQPLIPCAGNFYTCNRFKEADEDEVRRKDQSKAALDRYLHYYTRYINHHNSLKLEENTRKQMEEKVEELQAHGSNTWLDGQYLKEVRHAAHTGAVPTRWPCGRSGPPLTASLPPLRVSLLPAAPRASAAAPAAARRRRRHC